MARRVALIRYKYDAYGGAERYTEMLADSLSERGVEVHLFARRWKEPAGLGVFLHRVGGPGWPPFLSQATFVWLAGRAVRKESFDLVQSNERTLRQHVYRAGDGVHARWLELRAPYESWLRRLSLRINPSHLYRLWLERRLFESPDLRAVIVNSEMVRKEVLARFRIDPERIRTIYNGVDLARFHPRNREAAAGADFRELHSIDGAKPIVLFVGSGFKRKGLAFLLQAFARAGGDALLWVVGKDDPSAYRKLAQTLGIGPRVVFWGPQKDVAPFYGAADIFALPALYDPFPSVVLEAMASGLPVITTAQCGAAEIIDQGREGYVLEYPDKVAEMGRFLELLYDPDRRRAMAAAARKKAEAFPVERALQELQSLYDELLGQGCGAGAAS
jgi:UDP-glucose:(heptosyl)LPS alpha-1,3-glucosyltransferase